MAMASMQKVATELDGWYGATLAYAQQTLYLFSAHPDFIWLGFNWASAQLLCP